MVNRVSGKVALVTGAASGIGKAAAILLAQEGAFVVATDIDGTQGKLLTEQPAVTYLHQDVGSETDWKNTIQHIIKQFGRLDILVNNAGIIGLGENFGSQDPEHCSLEDWRHVHAINLGSVFLGCKYAIAAMKETGGGSIINLSSRSGMVGVPGLAPYASSKAAIRNHTKTVALYCAQNNYNIRCNSLHPAAILTPMWELMLGQGEAREAAIRHVAADIPLKRMGAPEDVAQAILYLASDESSYMTGSEITLDGGILAGSTASPQAK